MAKQRKDEKIGGGFFVFRRGKKTGRIGTRARTMPFEHPDLPAAKAEAERLANVHPGETFEVFQSSGFAAMLEATQ